MSPYLSQAGIFLIQIVFEFYILAVLLRFLFQLTRADFYNPISQFVVVLTNPPLKPLRRLIPGLLGIDLASVVLLIALKALEFFVIFSIKSVPWTLLGLLVSATADLLKLAVYVFIVAVLIRVVLSWVSPFGVRGNPAGALLVSLTEPLLAPARRLIPLIGGLDLSPIAVFIALQLVLMLLIQPLLDLGYVLLLR